MKRELLRLVGVLVAVGVLMLVFHLIRMAVGLEAFVTGSATVLTVIAAALVIYVVIYTAITLRKDRQR